MKKTPWTSAALIVMALFSTGCRKSPAETGNSPTNNAARYQQAVKFVGCLRENGFKEMSDPDATGELTVDGILNGLSIDPDGPAWKAAYGACKHLQPAGFMGKRRTEEQQKVALEFAQCMRDNGLKDFPDPTGDAPLLDTRRIPSLEGKDPRSDPTLQGAMAACRKVMADAMENQP